MYTSSTYRSDRDVNTYELFITITHINKCHTINDSTNVHYYTNVSSTSLHFF